MRTDASGVETLTYGPLLEEFVARYSAKVRASGSAMAIDREVAMFRRYGTSIPMRTAGLYARSENVVKNFSLAERQCEKGVVISNLS
jgi:hypothetical protein